MGYPVYYVPAGDVLPIFFDTYDGGTGASVTMTGLAVTDIEIYKDGSVTQRSSDAGYTLLDTDGIDFDTITGIHGFSIDTGDNTDASFYTVGAWFTVVVSAVTVDAQTVNFVAAMFRIMKAESVAGVPKADVDAWLGTAAATPTTAGVPEVDVTHVAGTAQTAGDLKASLNTIDDFLDTEVAAILAAVDTEITAIDDLIDTEVAAIKTVVDSIETKVDTIDNFLDTEIATLITMVTGIVPINGTIGATGNSTTALHLSGVAWADNDPNSMLLTIKDVSAGTFVSRWIEDWATAGDLATVATLPFTPEASVDLYWLTPIRADVTGGSGLDAAGVRAAIGLAAANLDTQIGTLATAAALTTVDDFLDTEVAAIKAKTDNLPAAPAATGDIPTAAAIADAVWDEDATAHQTQGTFGQAIGDPVADTNTIFKATVTDAAGATVGVDTTAIAAAVDTEVASVLAAVDTEVGDIRTRVLLALPAVAPAANGGLGTVDANNYIAGIAGTKNQLDDLNDLSAAQVNAEVDTALDTAIPAPTAGSINERIKTMDDADIPGRLPAALSGGKMDSVADVTAISGDTTAADKLEAALDGTVTGTVNDAGATTTAFITDLTSAVNDFYKNRIITFNTGALAGQQREITAYTGATKTVTVAALTSAPANGVAFTVT